jgi:hypothetical protein
MLFLLKLILNVLVLGLFLYSKLLPYKDRLIDPYKGVFNFFNRILSPMLNALKSLVKPFKVGTGLSVDMTQVILLTLFLILINLF